MVEPIKLLTRKALMPGSSPAFDKIEDFAERGMARHNPLLMHNYGRNILRKRRKDRLRA